MRRGRLLRLMLAAVCALLPAGVGGLTQAAPVATVAGPGHVIPHAVTPLPTEPLGEYADSLTFTLTAIDPSIVSADSSAIMTITGRYTNTTNYPISDLYYRLQRGDALATDQEIVDAISSPQQPVSVIEESFHPLADELGAHQHAILSAQVAVTDGAADEWARQVAQDVIPDFDNGTAADFIGSLGITAPGVYPVMININGTLQLPGGAVDARVGEAHVLVTVAGVPGGDSQVPGAAHPVGATEMSVLWPLVDRPHRTLRGVFTDDDLAADIAPGGRLFAAVDTLLGSELAEKYPQLVTLVIDPLLLDELTDMARGYQVLAQVQHTPQLLTVDTLDDPGETVTGSGASHAAVMIRMLRTLASRHDVIVLPYGDMDTVALTRASLTARLAAGYYRAQQVATEVLYPAAPTDTTPATGAGLLTDIVVPPAGLLNADTANVLAGLGMRSAIVGPEALDEADAAARRTADHPVNRLYSFTGDNAGAVATVGEAAWPVWRTESSGIPSLDRLAGLLGGNITDESVAGQWTGSNTTGHHIFLARTVAAQLRGDATGSLLLLPDRYWQPNATALSGFDTVVEQLITARLLNPISIKQLNIYAHHAIDGLDADGTDEADEADLVQWRYPKAAKKHEISQSLLGKVRHADNEIFQLSQSLAVDPDGDGADPADFLDPLSQVLLTAPSAAWRGDEGPLEATIETVRRSMKQLQRGVSIVASGGSYTLASATAPLMLTVQNTLPYQVSVRIGIIGGARAGFTIQSQPLAVLAAGPRTLPVKFTSEVSRSGTFTVNAQLRSMTGASWGPQVPITIDSRAYGALTVILMAVTSGVLVIMVALQLRQRWKNRGTVLEDDMPLQEESV